jgi:hypothetical protein
VLGPYTEGQVSTLNWVQKRVATFANDINVSGWEPGIVHIDSPNMLSFQGIHKEIGLESYRG